MIAIKVVAGLLLLFASWLLFRALIALPGPEDEGHISAGWSREDLRKRIVVQSAMGPAATGGGAPLQPLSVTRAGWSKGGRPALLSDLQGSCGGPRMQAASDGPCATRGAS